MSTYAKALMKIARETPDQLSRQEWTDAYERGLRVAFERKDLDGLVALVAVFSNRHDLDGTLDESIVEIEFALRQAGDNADARAVLLCARASTHASMGMLVAARDTLDEAVTIAGPRPNPTVVQRLVSTRVMLDCIGLDYAALPRLGEQIRAAAWSGDHLLAWFCMSWVIPLVLSGDSPRDAAPWSRQLRLETSTAHPWRQADALTFEHLLTVARGEATDDEVLARVRASQNWLARARMLVSELRAALLRRDLEATRELTTDLTALIPRAVPAFRDTWSGFAALLDAYSVPDRRITVPAPIEVSLQNLAATLATMEAVAIAGAQADALSWLNAAQRMIPPGTRTSPEWPVSVDRVMGLLQLRAGDLNGAARSIRKGIDWSARAGFRVEASIGRIQLAELMVRSRGQLGERRGEDLRRRAWQDLMELGIDPTFQAYVVSHISGRGTAAQLVETITPRQAQVLQLLARGMTYRQVAQELGITWKTVQSHAYRAYGKLEVDGKMEAAEVAQRIGII